MHETLEQILLSVRHPGRYIGGELNAVRKDRARVEVSMALAFPDVYEIGMSNLGLEILYFILNRTPWIWAERVFSPWTDLEAAMRASGLTLRTLESDTAVRDFDILGLSLSYELTYTNILNILDLSGVPLEARDRGEEAPLVIAGGPCAYNPEPLADFLDAVVVGDGEEVVLEICEATRHWKRSGRQGGKEALLRRLARVRGIYVPRLHDEASAAGRSADEGGAGRVRKRILPRLLPALYPSAPIVPLAQRVHDRVSVEIARGCTRGCRFCQAGIVYRPVRERSPDEVCALARERLAATGYEEISLLSLSAGDHSCLPDLLGRLMDEHADDRVALSLPSLRPEALLGSLAPQILRVRKTGFTLAPEVGSERLRRVINKPIDEEALLEAAATAYGLGWRRIKLYFMLGLPTEEEADIDAIVALARKIRKAARRARGGGRRRGRDEVGVSLSNFVPKAHTPFQWAPQLRMDPMRRRQMRLQAELGRLGLKAKWHAPEMSVLEGLLARGDRSTGAVIRSAWAYGCRFDGWGEALRFDLWERALRDHGIDADEVLDRERLPEEPFPWDRIDPGVGKAYLLGEYRRAKTGEITPDCRVGGCTACGACDDPGVRTRLARPGDAGATVGGGPVQEVAPELPVPATVPAVPKGGEPGAAVLTGWFEKIGAVRFIGHLEMVSTFHRAARRAGIPLAHSGGFHPMPRMKFGPALPVGVESVAEPFTFHLSEPVEADDFMARMNRELPQGIAVLEAHAVPEGTGRAPKEDERYLLSTSGGGTVEILCRHEEGGVPGVYTLIKLLFGRERDQLADLRILKARAREDGPPSREEQTRGSDNL